MVFRRKLEINNIGYIPYQGNGYLRLSRNKTTYNARLAELPYYSLRHSLSIHDMTRQGYFHP